MIFSEVLSQCVVSNMISGAIFKAGLINESYNLFSAFNEMYSATKTLLLLNLLPNPRGIRPLKAETLIVWVKYYLKLQENILW